MTNEKIEKTVKRTMYMAMHGINEIKVFDPDAEEGEAYHTRTVDEILASVNEAHSEDFTPYDHNDWVEGTIEFGWCVPVFPKGQRFWWTDCDRENPCDKFVTLAEEVTVESMGEIMPCEEGEFPMRELTPILGDDNHPIETVGEYVIFVAYNDQGKASYFVTDEEGNELCSFATIPEAKAYIESGAGQ